MFWANIIYYFSPIFEKYLNSHLDDMIKTPNNYFHRAFII